MAKPVLIIRVEVDEAYDPTLIDPVDIAHDLIDTRLWSSILDQYADHDVLDAEWETD